MLVHFLIMSHLHLQDLSGHLQAPPPLEIDVLLAPIASRKEVYNKPASNERATDLQVIADNRKG